MPAYLYSKKKKKKKSGTGGAQKRTAGKTRKRKPRKGRG
jgi:hypothetical protein